MKKIVVMSDNHGDYAMIRHIKKVENDGDIFVHCGDSEATSDVLRGWIAIKGNNDWMSDLKEESVFEVEGIRFLVCHGHRLPYLDREQHISYLLQEKQCQVLLCGHTHVPEHTKIDQFHIINPGSTTLPRRGSAHGYCLITVEQGKLKVNFKKVATR